MDLGQLHGSGPGGRIVKADVEGRKLRRSAVLDLTATVNLRSNPRRGSGSGDIGETRNGQGHGPYVELTKLQSTVARRMAESKATAPHFYLEAEIDMSRPSRPATG